MGLSYPYINGEYPTHAEIMLVPLPYTPGPSIIAQAVAAAVNGAGLAGAFNSLAGLTGLASLDYDWNMEGAPVYANDYLQIGETNGRYMAGARMGIYKPQYEALIFALAQFGRAFGLGYGQVHFNLQIQYTSPGVIFPTTDLLIGCRIHGASQRSSEGSQAPLVMECNIKPFYVAENEMIAGQSNLSAFVTGGGLLSIPVPVTM
jgi:hypothetical protein